MTTKDLAIGVLSMTAVMLLATLIIIQAVTPQQAMAYAQADRAGDYLVSTSQLDDTAELVVIVDAALQKMNIYGFNVNASQIELLQQIDLGLTQRTAQPAPRPANRREQR